MTTVIDFAIVSPKEFGRIRCERNRRARRLGQDFIMIRTIRVQIGVSDVLTLIRIGIFLNSVESAGPSAYNRRWLTPLVLWNPQMNRTIRIALSGLIALSALGMTAVAEDKAKSVEGAWKQLEQKNGPAQEYQKIPDGMVMTDCIVGGRFIWTMVQNGKVVGVAGGRYKTDKDKFTEIIEYVSGEGVPESFVGSSFDFTVKVDGDKMTKVGTIQVGGQDFKIDEKWERCEK